MITQSRRTDSLKVLGAAAIMTLAAGCINAVTNNETNDELLKTFAGIKRDQCKLISEKLNKEIPCEFVDFFAAAACADWNKTKTMYRDIRKRAGQYADSTTNDLQTAMWAPVMETFGAVEQFTAWDPSLINYYGEEILNSIPGDGILFGGTDSGRFVLTTFLETRKTPSQYLITQNALADDAYMTYLRITLGDKAWLPDTGAVNQAFKDYVSEVQAGHIQSNANIAVDANGKVSVKGVQGVMEVNGIIAKLIFARNKEKHPFYVEESYVIPWMYPCLEPHGLIMKLNAEPLGSLSREVVEKDRQYWDACVVKLMGDQCFLQNPPARKTFAKLRCAIAGLYAYRKNMQEAEHAFKQALTLFPQSPEANFRLADLYCQQGRFTDAKRVMEVTLAYEPVDVLGDGMEILCDRNAQDRAREYIKTIEKMEKSQNKDKTE